MDRMDEMDPPSPRGFGETSGMDEVEEDVFRRWFSRVGIIGGMEKERVRGFWRAAFGMLERARIKLSRMRSWRWLTAEAQRVSEGKGFGSWKPAIGGGVRSDSDSDLLIRQPRFDEPLERSHNFLSIKGHPYSYSVLTRNPEVQSSASTT